MGKKSVCYTKENDNDDYSVGVDWNISGPAGDIESESVSDTSGMKPKSKSGKGKGLKMSSVKNSAPKFQPRQQMCMSSLNAIVIPTYPSSTGTEKFRADYRQFSSLLLATSICMSFTWLPELANAAFATTSLEWAIFVAAACQTLVGVAGSALGVLGCFYDFGHLYLTVAFIGMSQLSWLPCATQIAHLASGIGSIPENNPFIPYDEYSPTQADVIILGVMAVFSAAVYSISTTGPVIFSSLALYEYQRGAFHTRAAAYFRTRAYFYNGLVLAGGASMFFSGLYSHLRFGAQWDHASPVPIHVGMYLISSPALVMAAGAMQLVFGSFGVFRTMRKTLRRNEWSGGNSPTMSVLFPFVAIVTWSMMVGIQAAAPFRMSPSLYGEGGSNGSAIVAIAPTSLAAAMVGYILMPIFLDAKMKVTPEEIESDYYGELEFLHLEGDTDTDSRAIGTDIGNSASFSP
jgi:hypothetical protein